MVDSVAFLLQQPLNDRNRQRFGVDLLQQNGFAVRAYNLAPLLYPHDSPGNADSGGEAVDIRSEADLAGAMVDVARPQTFVVALVGYSPESHIVFRQLSHRRIAYAVARLGTFPVDQGETSGLARVARFWRNRRSMSVSRLVARVGFAARRPVAAPAYRLLGGTEAARQISPAGNGRAIWVHAFDYDRFLESRRAATVRDDAPYAVFLDQYLPAHPDFVAMKEPFPVTAGVYHESLRRFFDLIEARYGLRVIIAAHPKADYAGPDKPFGDRAIRRDTIDLVKHARLVLAHYSTAINFAVLFRRPLLFLTTAELARRGFSARVRAAADSLAAPVVDIDAVQGVPDAAVDEARYARYVESFITTRPDETRPTWKIVADELKNI